MGLFMRNPLSIPLKFQEGEIPHSFISLRMKECQVCGRNLGREEEWGIF